jgi:hypothetical protein
MLEVLFPVLGRVDKMPDRKADWVTRKKPR